MLARQPDSLHMIGLMPFVRTTAFDMVSDGKSFKLWIPPKNKFVIGENKVKTPNADQPMESIRPQNIYEALLIRRIDPDQRDRGAGEWVRDLARRQGASRLAGRL